MHSLPYAFEILLPMTQTTDNSHVDVVVDGCGSGQKQAISATAQRATADRNGESKRQHIPNISYTNLSHFNVGCRYVYRPNSEKVN